MHDFLWHLRGVAAGLLPPRQFGVDQLCRLHVVILYVTRKAAVFVHQKAEAPLLFQQGFFAAVCNKFLDFILARGNGFYILHLLVFVFQCISSSLTFPSDLLQLRLRFLQRIQFIPVFGLVSFQSRVHVFHVEVCLLLQLVYNLFVEFLKFSSRLSLSFLWMLEISMRTWPSSVDTGDPAALSPILATPS